MMLPPSGMKSRLGPSLSLGILLYAVLVAVTASMPADECRSILDCALKKRHFCKPGSSHCGPCLAPFVENAEGLCVVSEGHAHSARVASIPELDEEIDFLSAVIAKQQEPGVKQSAGGPKEKKEPENKDKPKKKKPKKQDDPKAKEPPEKDDPKAKEPPEKDDPNAKEPPEDNDPKPKEPPENPESPTEEEQSETPVKDPKPPVPPHPGPHQPKKSNGGGPSVVPYRSTDAVLLILISVFVIMGIIALILAAVCWIRLQKDSRLAQKADYPGFSGAPPVSSSNGSSPGDKTLAKNAQMYHYQHQKQQMLCMDKHKEEAKMPESEATSEEENEDGDFTVYECPGLAPTGEMEVKNPLFDDSATYPQKNHK